MIRRTVDVGAVPGETVIEIGPGQGVLTAQLLEAGARVVAVEVDRDLVASLRERFHGQAFEVTNADVLKTDIGALMEAGAPSDWWAICPTTFRPRCSRKNWGAGLRLAI